MKILIVAPAWIGDAIMAQPLYRLLKQQYANLTLDVLAPAWSRPLLNRMPEVDLAIDNPFTHGQVQFWQRWRLGRKLKKNQYDQAIVLPNSFKSALIPFFAGVPRRVGYIGEKRYGLLNDIRRLYPTQLPRMVDRFTALGLSVLEQRINAETNLSMPQYYPCLTVDSQQRQTTLAQFNLSTEKPIAAFCPGAEYGPAKRWPAEYFARLAQILQEQGFDIWIFGSFKEQAIGHAIVTKSALNTEIHNLCGKTTLAQAIDLMSLVSVVISNDSGLMHMAAALQRPLVALYGSSSPSFTPPLSDLAHIQNLNLECSPCFARECPLVHFNCMRMMLPESVAQTVANAVTPSSIENNAIY